MRTKFLHNYSAAAPIHVPSQPRSFIEVLVTGLTTLLLCFQGGSIQNKKSRRCLELVASSDNEFGYQLVLQKCTGQKWFITNVLFSTSL